MEAASEVGGGCRSAELTLPGFIYDVCSAVFPLGAGSPFLARLPLARHGLRWIEPEVQIAHPLPEGAAVVVRDPEVTAQRLGADAGAYLRLAGPVRDWRIILDDLVGPLRVPLDPRKAIAAARFASRALWPATVLARRFRTPAARALFDARPFGATLRRVRPHYARGRARGRLADRRWRRSDALRRARRASRRARRQDRD
jgi:phytoene dehydrogenase-like protein